MEDLPQNTFLGTGWSFPPEFDHNTNEVKTVSNYQDIRESLHILLGTSPGERLMDPEYGCGIRDILFDTLDESTITYAKNIIRKSIIRYEPRIDLHSVEINSENYLDGLLFINVDYTVRETNTRTNMVYPYYTIEGTDLRDRAALDAGK